jgi:hypothetical protein
MWLKETAEWHRLPSVAVTVDYKVAQLQRKLQTVSEMGYNCFDRTASHVKEVISVAS